MNPQHGNSWNEAWLPPREVQLALLDIARAAVARALDDAAPAHAREAFGHVPDDGHSALLQKMLQASGGLFVTLRRKDKHDALRGCIGRMFSTQELRQSLPIVARDAAFSDHRFPPVTHSELELLRFEISLLSPLEPCQPEDIELGTHGVQLTLDGRSAVFLPEVAISQGWTRQMMFEQLSRKAGLPTQAWKAAQAKYMRFTSMHFGED